MTRVYSEQGQAIPVTVIEAGPCVILQKKKTEHGQNLCRPQAYHDSKGADAGRSKADGPAAR